MPEKIYVVEARHPDGTLDVKRIGTEPFSEATERQLIDYFFAHHPELEKCSMEQVIEFFKSQGWHIRPKYW